jgi:hypothetical protein
MGEFRVLKDLTQPWNWWFFFFETLKKWSFGGLLFH